MLRHARKLLLMKANSSIRIRMMMGDSLPCLPSTSASTMGILKNNRKMLQSTISNHPFQTSTRNPCSNSVEGEIEPDLKRKRLHRCTYPPKRSTYSASRLPMKCLEGRSLGRVRRRLQSSPISLWMRIMRSMISIFDPSLII